MIFLLDDLLDVWFTYLSNVPNLTTSMNELCVKLIELLPRMRDHLKTGLSILDCYSLLQSPILLQNLPRLNSSLIELGKEGSFSSLNLITKSVSNIIQLYKPESMRGGHLNSVLLFLIFQLSQIQDEHYASVNCYELFSRLILEDLNSFARLLDELNSMHPHGADQFFKIWLDCVSSFKNIF